MLSDVHWLTETFGSGDFIVPPPSHVNFPFVLNGHNGSDLAEHSFSLSVGGGGEGSCL